MKYLKKYSTEAERQAATAIEPSASIVVEDEGVYYDRAWDTPTEVINHYEYITIDGGLEPKNVNFWDYDGTLMYAYTDTEFLAMDNMPNNPGHEGLTAQGWNWSITNAKAYVTKYRYLEIGQQYTTDDGHTRIYITIPENFPYMEFGVSCARTVDMVAAGSLNIKWGDSDTSEIFGTAKGSIGVYHTYAASGSYVIEIWSNNNSKYHLGGNKGATVTTVIESAYLSLFGDAYYDTNPDLVIRQLSCVTKVEVGDNVTALNIVGTDNLETVTVNKNLVYYKPLLRDHYTYIPKIKAAIYPQSMEYWTGIGTNSTASQVVQYMKCLCFSDAPNIASSNQPICIIGSVAHITIPESFPFTNNNSIVPGPYLKVLVYPDNLTTITSNNILPNTLTNLRYLHLPINLTSIVASVNARSIEELIIPNTLTSLPANFFSGCQSLRYVNIPEGITTLGNNAFACPCNMKKASLPTTITTIGSGLFGTASPFYEVYIYATTPPTLSNVNSFPVSKNRSYSVKKPFIHVPPGTLTDYQTATTWSGIADYIEEMTQAEYTAYCTEHNIENE